MEDSASDFGFTDDQLAAVENMTLNDGGEETAAPAPSTAGGQQTTDESTVTGSEGTAGDGQQKPEDNPKTGEEEDKPQGRPEKHARVEQRIGQLTGKIREKDEVIDNLHKELAAIKRAETLKPPTPDENGNINANDLMEYNRKQAEVAAKEAVAEATTAAQAETVIARYEREDSEILQAYPMLNPENASLDPSDPNAYNPKIAERVWSKIEEKIGPHMLAKNVTALARISPRAIADEYMSDIAEAAEAAAARERTRLAGNMQALRASDSGIFSGGAAPSKDGDSLDDLEARIGNISLA